jgi:ubiquinone/menaquinone biosynthesis C-methylase UbiE
MNDIVDFYTAYDEKNRLITRHSIERIRSEIIIRRYLINKRMRILDIGGAAGIYSFWLAELGHSVSLIDLTPKHIEQANEIQKTKVDKLESITLGDACNLQFEDKSFDLVLLMGPLYHLQNRTERVSALRESYRVLKENGTCICAAISRYASMFDGYIRSMIKDSRFYEIMEQDIKTGKHMNPENNPSYFTNAYFHHNYELKDEIIESGYKYERIIPVEGFSLCIPEIEQKILDDEYREKLLLDLNNLECDQTIIGLSPHYLGVGKK